MAYKAVISKIYLREHPNADRLQLGTVLGNQVVVAKGSYSEGDLVIFFPTDGQLSDEYCLANDLYPRFNEAGERINAGYIDVKNRRVRSQKFRKEKSDGLVMPISSLLFTGITMSELEGLGESYTFDTINNVPICNKYYTPKTLRAIQKQNKQSKKVVNVMFKKHFDTEQWKYFADQVKPNSLIVLTEKIHGTSQRSMNAYEEITEKRNIFKWIPFDHPLLYKTTGEWKMMHGTRNVIMTSEKDGYYGDAAFRWAIANRISLRKGEGIYYEVAGWTNSETPIMPFVSTEPVQDKAFTERFGKEMKYLYLCPEGCTRAFIYRYTVSNMDGEQWDLPWSAVKQRATELGMETVPEIYPPFYYTGEQEELKALVELATDGESLIDPSHIREGVCVRVEAPDGTVSIYKNKSWSFGVMEGYIKNDNDYVDMEEVS